MSKALSHIRGRGGIALLILKLRTRRSSGVTAHPGCFTPEEAPLPGAL